MTIHEANRGGLHPSMPGRRRATRVSALVVGAVLAVAGCSSPSRDASTATSVAPVPTVAASNGGSAAGSGSGALRPLDRAALDEAVAKVATELRQPGMVVLIRTPQGEYVNTHGVTERNGTTPVALNTRVRIGSNTKTWTGTAVLQMVQEGRIALTDPVSKYLPGVPGGDTITIAQLGDMRSGLYNYTETLELNRALDDEPQKVWTNEELLGLAFAHPAYFPPGQGWHYSNTNTVLLGEIAEQIDGKPLGQIFQDRFFTPLGMTGSSYPAAADTAIPAPSSRGYLYGTNVETMEDPSIPADQLAQVEAGTLAPRDVTNDNPSWTGAAGQGISTATDLATWVGAMVDGQLLDAATQQARMDGVLPTGSGTSYGFTLAKMGPLYGHTGELPGFNSFMGYDPVNKVTIVAWGNSAPFADGRPPAVTLVKDLVPLLYDAAPPAEVPEGGLPD
ncbi:serine hydrolase domain-containing protein [Pseudonocardia sp.]|jgi:D-alanyl-D-alanine carboxypeptidase|uniref:serine hydrolase domain-containing protein n=1 Tax=Pseudonocardia sp. TaxID=60912 RepID=UPI0031FD8E0E